MSNQQTTANPSALTQFMTMTAYLAACAFGYQPLLKTNISQDVSEAVLMLALSLGLIFPAWKYGIFSPAIGTYAGWVVLGVIAAYTLG